MFTDCPSCERLFRIRAAQLKAADGWVRCGYCAEAFFALERLYDVPVKKPAADIAPGVAAAIPAVTGAEPVHAETEVPAVQQPEQPAEQGGEAIDITEAVEQEQPLPEYSGEDWPADPGQHIPEPVEATAVHQDSAGSVTAEITEDPGSEDELPPVLESEVDNTGRSYSRFIRSGLITILLLIALAQFAWFNRDWLLREHPQLAPWAEKLCERLQCDLIRFRDLSAIRLLDRDVRMHPRYRNAVLVSATMVNHAEFIQPYPEIELVIYGTNGRVISHGSFTAVEYLAPDISLTAGMVPGVPAHAELELAGAAQEAVSFEFRFH